MENTQPSDYCPQCGAYHAIYGPCDSEQTEPDEDVDNKPILNEKS